MTLNDTLDQMHLIDTYRIFHPTASEYKFFSSAHKTFPNIDHMIGCKYVLTSSGKFKLYQASSQNGMKLEFYYSKKN